MNKKGASVEEQDAEMVTTRMIIFDCDGVLVDSEGPGNEVLAAFITEQGWHLDARECRARFQGRAIGDVWQEVEKRTGSPITDRQNREFRSRQLVALGSVRPMPGILELLEALAIPFCVASNGPHAKMRVTLQATGLASAFAGRIFSAEEVARPKPCPDLFLHAAGQMGFDPHDCAVIEDSVLGIEAALAAGMRALGYSASRESQTALRQAGAHAVVAALPEILALL